MTSYAIGGNNVFVHGKNSHVTLKNVLLDAYGAASNRCVYVSFGGTLEAEDGNAQTILHLSSDSRWELTGDSVIHTLVNEDPTNSNISLRGHRLTIQP